jgi:hypothetical protein
MRPRDKATIQSKGRLARTLIAAAAMAVLLPTPGAAQYVLPQGHPRIFFNAQTFGAIADRCKIGGTHRAYYTTLLAFTDDRIAQGTYVASYLPAYALVYRIHRQWNQTGYQGGGFVEDKYWQAARSGVTNSGNWQVNDVGANAAIAMDWIWERLTQAEIAQAASNFGSPQGWADNDTWRTDNSYIIAARAIRSILFVGAGVNDPGYANEYQSMMSYLQTTYPAALNLQGGVGSSGPQYENDSQYLRSWALEAARVATGVDPWPQCQKWASEYGQWNIYAQNPLTGGAELQQDATPFSYVNDTAWNSALIALRGRDSCAQLIASDFWQSSQSWQVGDYRKRALWCFVLWYDPMLAPFDPATAPLSVRLGAGGMDHIYMRSSWTDPDYLLAEFEAGKYFYGHQHYDAGSFIIARKGYLALDSGGYYTYHSTNGADHSTSYFKRSIAHNTLHVYDPSETFWSNTDSNQQVVNDGGQHIPPSDPTYQDLLTKPVFSPGQMLRYEASGVHTYAQANLAGAYNSSALMQMYNKPAYTNKISTYTREFFYARPDIFVVIDRVRSKSASLSKVWNLHVANAPQVTGTAVQRMGTASAGIWEYAGAEVFKVTDTNSHFDRGSMYVKSLYPKQRLVRVIGGDNRNAGGFAYWSGGINASGRYDPTLGANHYWGSWTAGNSYLENSIWAAPIGWGRVEVEPTVQALDDIFLHVLIPCDEALAAMPDTRLLESPNAVGAEVVNRQVVVFGRTETANLDSVTYSVAPNDTAAVHTIVDLTPGGAYRVFKSGTTYYLRRSTHPAPAGATEIVTPPPTASSAGVIEFASVGGSLQIQVSNVAVQYQAGVLGATITWQTNLASDSQVEFGTTTAYGQTSPLLPALVTSHSVTLGASAILNDVLYQFRAVSRAPGGYVGMSANGQFRSDAVSPSRVNDLLVR